MIKHENTRMQSTIQGITHDTVEIRAAIMKNNSSIRLIQQIAGVSCVLLVGFVFYKYYTKSEQKNIEKKK